MGLLASPETVTGAAHVPVGEDVGVLTHLIAGIRDAGIGQSLVHVRYQVVRLGEDVAIQHVIGVHGPARLLGGVELQEAVRIPDWQQRLAHALTDSLLGDDQIAATQDRAGHEEPAHRVGAVAVEDLIDVRVVALGLGHLQPVGAQDDAVGDDLLEGRAVEQCGGKYVLDVEPAAGLAGVLDDEVRRLLLLEGLHVLEWVVVLGERHGARLEPAVEDVRDAAHHGLAGRVVRVRANQLVDVRAVQGLRSDTEVGLQLLEGAIDVHARVLRIIRHPGWDRRTPVAGAGDVPIAGALQPLTELAVADVFRDPLDLLVEFHHAVADLKHIHEPAGQSHVDQRLAGAPGMRVGVDNRLIAQDALLGLQVADDVAVGVENQRALVLGNQGGELAVGVHRDDQVDAVALTDVHIVLTEGRGLVDDTGTVLGGDVVRHEHHEGVFLISEVIEDRGVLQALELSTCEGGQHLWLLAQLLGIGPQQRGGQQQLGSSEALRAVFADLDQGVLDLRADGQGEVGRQRPRGRRPGDGCGVVQLGVSFPGLGGWVALACTGERHGHGDGRVLAVAVGVVEAGLLVRQRGVLGPGVRQHAEALVDQALVVELLEGPHDGLHVVLVHGLVAVLEVDPASLTGDVVLPLVGVVHDGLGAVLVEAVQSHGLDLALVGDAQLLLRLQLGRKAVAVPAEDARDVVAGHGAVARDDVLDVASEQVAVVRQAIGERRTVVEDVFLIALAVVKAGLEGVVLLPVLQYLFFHGWEVAAPAAHVHAGVDAASWCSHKKILVSGA